MLRMHIVMIGSNPSSESVIFSDTICKENNFKLKLYLIDVNYLHTKHNFPNEITHYYHDNDDYEGDMTVSIFPDPYENLFHSTQERVSSENAKFLDHLKSTTDPVWYYSELHQNGYDLARSVHTKTFNKKYFRYIATEDLTDIVRSIIKYNEVNVVDNGELYNPVSGQKITQTLNTYDKANLKDTLNLGFNYLIWFLKSGFHKDKDFLNPDIQAPGWVFQMSSRWLTLLVDVYDIRPYCPDTSVQMQMNESSDFRKMITEGTLAVLTNYVINNNIANNQSWYDHNTWNSLLKKHMENF